MYQDQTDANKGAAIVAFLNYIYKEGQKLAGSVDYAPLPKALLKQAQAQVKKHHRPGVVISGGSCTGRVPPTRPVPPLVTSHLA